MEKKVYNGLAVEVISFGADDLETGLIKESGCRLGTVQYYTEDGQGHSMPIGVCWVKESNTYSLEWDEWTGDYIP